MTLQCSVCGGSWTLEYTEQIYPDDPNALSVERHRCTNCGSTGTHRFGTIHGENVSELEGDLEVVFD